MFRLPRVLPAALIAFTACTSAPRRDAGATVIAVAQQSPTSSLLIAVSAVDEKIVWVSGQHGSWLRTIDGGAHWTSGRVAGADTLQFRDVQGIDADRAYLLSIGNGDQSRIYMTTDAGGHWMLQFTNPEPKGFYDCIGFWDRDRGLAIGDAIGDQMAILVTNDAGAHWDRIPPASLPRAQPNEGSFAASGSCLATRPGGLAWIVMNNAEHSRLLRTPDFGRTWTVDTLPLTTRDGVGAQSVSFRDDRHGIVLGGGYGAKPGDIESAVTVDGGATWMAAGRPPMTTGVWGGVFVPGAREPTVVAVGPGGSAYSIDEGKNWTAIDTLNYWSVGFASPKAGWAVGQGGRITRLTTTP